MTGRILRIELRRSAAFWAAALIAGLGALALYASGNPRVEWWIELFFEQRDVLQLSWPLALGAGAWQARRERRSHTEELIATTPRPRWRRVLPTAGAMAIAAFVAYLVMAATTLGRLTSMSGYFPVQGLPVVAVGALTLVAAVWLGMAIGSLVPWPLTPPLVAIAGFAAIAVIPPSLHHGRNRPGTVLLLPQAQLSWAGEDFFYFHIRTFTVRGNLIQALWFLALAAAGLALLAAATRRARVAALLPVVLGAAIVGPMLPRQVSAAFADDPGAVAPVCTSDAPTVCVVRIHADRLASLRGPAREALAILAAKLPAPTPTRAAEDTRPETIPTPPQSPDVLLIPLFELRIGDEVMQLLDGAGTRGCREFRATPENPNLRYDVARLVAAAWLLGRPLAQPGQKAEGDPFLELALPALEALNGLPAAEQRARVTALRAAELTCAPGDRLDILTGGSR